MLKPCSMIVVGVLSLGQARALTPIPDFAQATYFKASNTASAAEFGDALAVSGNTLVVGSPQFGLSEGAAYVFVRDGSTWTQQAFLQAPLVSSSDRFGLSVDIDGDTILVGAPGSGNFGNPNAYIFERTGSSWSHTASLSNPALDPNVQHGFSVALQSGTAVIAAPSGFVTPSRGAYVYQRNGSAWGLVVNLKDIASVASSFDSVDIDADTIAAGSNDHCSVFVRSGSHWSEQAVLQSSNWSTFDDFGESVSISADTVVVGAKGEDSSAIQVNGDSTDNSTPNAGAAYVFVRNGTNWTEQAYLKAPNSNEEDRFGTTVAISGDVIAVGAHNEDSPASGINGTEGNGLPQSGAAYLFARSGQDWTKSAYVKASNPGSPDAFGRAIALDQGRLAIGAPREKSNATGVNGDTSDNSLPSAGAAYVYDCTSLPKFYCPAKASSAGCLAALWTTDLLALPTSGNGDYSVTAGGVQEGKNGLLFGSLSGPATLPFNGGTLCVQPPTKRGPLANSGGRNPNNCKGRFSTVVNDGSVIPLGLDAGAGNTAWYQYWYRDSQNGPGQLGTALSNAVELSFQ